MRTVMDNCGANRMNGANADVTDVHEILQPQV